MLAKHICVFSITIIYAFKHTLNCTLRFVSCNFISNCIYIVIFYIKYEVFFAFRKGSTFYFQRFPVKLIYISGTETAAEAKYKNKIWEIRRRGNMNNVIGI